MKIRPEKKNDQQEIEKAFRLLKKCVDDHPEIEETLWTSAFWSILVIGYSLSGMTYEQFNSEWDRVKHHYKRFFD